MECGVNKEYNFEYFSIAGPLALGIAGEKKIPVSQREKTKLKYDS